MSTAAPVAIKKDFPDYSGKKFLVADDKPFIRGIIQSMLLRCKVRHLKFAADGNEAMKVLSADGGVDCVIADWNMEPVDGLELLRLVRMGAISGVPRDGRFIMLTGHAEVDLVKSARNLDVSGFLVKPVSIEKLLKALENTFGSTIDVKRPADYQDVGVVKLPGTLNATTHKAVPWVFRTRKAVESERIAKRLRAIRQEMNRQLRDREPAGPIVNKTKQNLEIIPPGMVLAEDIFSGDGQLLLATGVVLTESLLARLKEIAAEADQKASLLVGWFHGSRAA